MTDTQTTIKKFLDDLYEDELKIMDEESNDPYITGWNECLSYIRTKAYSNMYVMARKGSTTFINKLDK